MASWSYVAAGPASGGGGGCGADTDIKRKALVGQLVVTCCYKYKIPFRFWLYSWLERRTSGGCRLKSRLVVYVKPRRWAGAGNLVAIARLVKQPERLPGFAYRQAGRLAG